MLTDFVTGIRAFRRGVKLSFEKPVLPYLILPNLVNSVLFIIAGYVLFNYSSFWASTASGLLPNWLAWMDVVVEVLIGGLAILLFIMILATTFSLITGLLIAPFLAILSEKIESNLRPINYPSLKLREIVGRSLLRELVRLRYIILRLVLLLIVISLIGVVPGLNLFVPIIWFFYNAWMKSIEFCDFAADNNGYDLPSTLAKLKQNRALALGFGSAAYLATIIPVVNLFALPMAVSGATYLWVEEIEKKQEKKTQNQRTEQS